MPMIPYKFSPTTHIDPLYKVLYKRDINNNILTWSIRLYREKYKLIIEHGRLDSANKTSSTIRVRDLEHAEEVVASRVRRKKMLGYKPVAPHQNIIDVLPLHNTDSNNRSKPAKCAKFTNKHFVPMMLGQAKVNGVRATIRYEERPNDTLFESKSPVVILSKEGLEYNVKHIQDMFNEHVYSDITNTDIVFDGELYIPNEAVTTIGGASRNSKNAKHSDLVFVIFDIAMDMPQTDRTSILYDIFKDINAIGIEVHNHLQYITADPIQVLFSQIMASTEECYDFMQSCKKLGFEGAVFRDPDATYKFGQRTKHMLKLKTFEDAEFEIIDIELIRSDDSNIGVSLLYHLKNDVNDLTFTASGMGTVEEKETIFNNRHEHVGKKATVKFYERTVNKLPFHANVIAIRDYE